MTYQQTQSTNHEMNILNEGWPFEWTNQISKQLVATEQSEYDLSYVSECRTEDARKRIGSYYTPIDVARLFWKIFFEAKRIEGSLAARNFVSENKFTEPSVGAGVLFFALLEKLASDGVSPDVLAAIDIEFIDINAAALSFVKKRIYELENIWGVKFKNSRYMNEDFRNVLFEHSLKPRVFFGNPPFVTNSRGSSRWKNLFADFLETSLKIAGPQGSVQYILPLSIAFSRNYSNLRTMLRNRKSKILMSNFDNIPDTLFKSGKPRHNNTNKANSQRCTILSVTPKEQIFIASTPLLRWTKAERSKVLCSSPLYIDTTDYAFDDQIPRPRNERILQYLDQCREVSRLESFIDSNGKYSAFVASVARNFIGVRDESGSGTHHLRLRCDDDVYKVIMIVSSDIFFDYWLSIGDGFHLTKSNLLNFPLHPELQNAMNVRLPASRKIWKVRKDFLKTKLNSGHETRSYDLSQGFESLWSCLKNREETLVAPSEWVDLRRIKQYSLFDTI